jgi:hypothetical protein
MDIVVEVAGEPRMRDLVLAERLGMSNRYKIRELIGRHMDRLQQLGPVSVTLSAEEKEGFPHRGENLGGRPSKTFWLNRKQVLYLCAKSETPRAADVTIAMVEVFDAWLEGKRVPVKEHMRRPPQREPAPLPPPAPSAIEKSFFLMTPAPFGMRHVTAIIEERYALRMAAIYCERHQAA